MGHACWVLLVDTARSGGSGSERIAEPGGEERASEPRIACAAVPRGAYVGVYWRSRRRLLPLAQAGLQERDGSGGCLRERPLGVRPFLVQQLERQPAAVADLGRGV